MALDPRVISALSAGAKATSTYTPGVYEGPKSSGGFSLGQSVIDILSTGGYATAGLTSKVGQNIAAIGRGELGGLADLINPLSGVAAMGRGVAERRTYSENLKDLGVEDKTAVWLGLALDIGLDPTTYITGGLLAGAKGGVQGARLASKATKAGKVAAKGDSLIPQATRLAGAARPSFIPVSRDLTNSEKIGNLLTGINAGFQKGKANYKVSIAGNKLQRLSNRQARKLEKGAEAVRGEVGLPSTYAAKVSKQKAKLEKAQAAAEAISSPVTAGTTRRAVPGAEVGMAASAAKVSEEIAVGSQLNNKLNELAQTLTKPGAETAPVDASRFEKIKDSFLDKAFDFSSREVANLRSAVGEYDDISAGLVRKYVTDPAAAKVSPSTATMIDDLLAAPAVIADDSIELQEALVAMGGKLDDATADDLLYIADEATDPVVKAQAEAAFDATKAALNSEAIAAPGANRAWLEGIHTPDDAGDAARAIVDWLSPELRNGDPASYKAISNAIEAELKPRLVAAVEDGKTALTPEGVEAVVGKMLDEGLAGPLGKVTKDDLAKASANTYNDIAELAGDLQAGKVTLAASDMAKLSDVLGIPAENVEAAVIKLANSADGIGAIIDPLSDATQTGKGVITPTEAVNASGNASGAGAAEAAEDVIGANTIIEDAISGAPSGTEEAAYLQMREAAATELTDSLIAAGGALDPAERTRIAQIVRDSILPAIMKQVASLAKARDMSVNEVLREAMEKGLKEITEDPEAFTIGGALKLDELGSHGRIDVHSRLLVGDEAKNLYRSKNTRVIEREILTGALVENLFRSLGIPARSTESMQMALQHRKIKPNSKKARSIKPGYSSVTWTDIARLMLQGGKGDLAWELRKFRGQGGQGYSYGNFLPTSIESAWIHVKRLKENGGDFTKGSPDFDEIRFALDNIERKGGGFEPGMHVKAGEALGTSAQIQKVGDDLIEFLSENYDALKAIDDQREGLIVAANAIKVRENAVGLFADMIRFNSDYRAFKEEAKLGTVSREGAEAGFNNLLTKYADFLEEISTGNFSDTVLAQNTASVYKSIFMNGFIDVPSGRLSLAPFMNHMESAIMVAKAINDAPTAAAGKNARRSVKEKRIAREFDITAETLIRANDAGKPAPSSAEDIAIASQEIMSLNDAFAKADTFFRGLGQKFVGNFGMGAGAKTILSATEQQALSHSHRFSLRLYELRKMARGREGEIRSAFKAVQAYRKQVTALEELGETLPVEQFLAEFGGGFDRDFFDLIDGSLEELLGSASNFGAAKSLGVMGEELNVSLRQLGLGDLQVGPGQDISTFWHFFDMDKSKVAKDPLEFLQMINMGVHRAGARVEIAAQFNHFVGRTVDDIKRAKESLDDYVKIDTDTTIGKVLGDTEKLVHKDDYERLKYVQKFLDYESSFSNDAVRRLVEVSDRITYVLKSSNTLIRPGHHVVSIVGEAAMNALAGVRLSSYNNSARILNKFRPGQYNEGDSLRAYAAGQAPKGKRLNATEFDNTYWINPKGQREAIPDEVLYRLAEKHGALVSPGGSLEDFIASSDDVIKGAYGSFHRGMNKIGVFAAHRDNLFRLSHFIDELQKTKGAKSLDEAAQAAGTVIREWHPTTGSLSAFERKYMRRAVYFYTWQRVAITKVIGSLAERPGIATIPSKIQYAFADANGFNPESFGDPWDPDGIYASWHTGSVFGPQVRSPLDGAGFPVGDVVGIRPPIQPIDILAQTFESFSGQPGENPLLAIANGVGSTFANNMTPIAKTLIESSAQSRLGEGGDLPSPTEYLINQVGFVNTISKLTGIGQDENPYETPEEKREKDNRLILNLILGQRITDYQTPMTNYKWTLDQQEMARRLAGQ